MTIHGTYHIIVHAIRNIILYITERHTFMTIIREPVPDNELKPALCYEDEAYFFHFKDEYERSYIIKNLYAALGADPVLTTLSSYDCLTEDGLLELTNLLIRKAANL